MQTFLEGKGIKVTKTEGDDFSAVFHVSPKDREKIENNKEEYEKETGLLMATSNMGGFSIVIMENEE